MVPEKVKANLEQTPAGELVLGEPVTVRDITLVPVVSVSTTYRCNTAGGVGTFIMHPVAVVVSGKDGTRVHTLSNLVEKEALSGALQKYEDREP